MRSMNQAVNPNVMGFEDLKKIAAANKLLPTETFFFTDLITEFFPVCTKSYADTWAKRIARRSEYHFASGDVRRWIDDNFYYDRVKEEREKHPFKNTRIKHIGELH
jgi:hypothetical protein